MSHSIACELSDKFFKSRTMAMSSYGCCDVTFDHSDGTIAKHLNNGCHGFMNAPHPHEGSIKWDKLETVTTSLFSTELMKPLAEAYWSFICGKDSPWREVTKDAVLIRRDNGDMCGVRVNAHLPAQLLVNFFIATRQPNEHATHVVSFNEYLKEGFTPCQAMYLSNFALLQPTIPPRKAGSTAHYPLNFGISWAKFKNGAADIGQSKDYTKDHQYLPCNSIWDKGTRKAPTQNYVTPSNLISDVPGIYKYLGDRKAYGGSFEKLYNISVRADDKLPLRPELIANINKYSKEIFCEA